MFICPKFEVSSPVPRLTDLPNHPRDLESIEHVNVLPNNIRFVSTFGPKLLEENKLPGRLGALKRNRRFVAELRNAAVRVNVDEIKGRAGPVLRYIGVWELVPATWIVVVIIKFVVDGKGTKLRGVLGGLPVDMSIELLPMMLRIFLLRSHHQLGAGAILPRKWPWPSF